MKTRIEELAEMLAAPQCLITKWNPTHKDSEGDRKGGFGFVRVDGRNTFVHISNVDTFGGETSDLSGKTLVVYSTEQTPKGLSVVRAATLKQHEARLADIRQDIQREEERELLRQTRVAEAKLAIALMEGQIVELANRLLDCRDKTGNLFPGKGIIEVRILPAYIGTVDREALTSQVVSVEVEVSFIYSDYSIPEYQRRIYKEKRFLRKVNLSWEDVILGWCTWDRSSATVNVACTLKSSAPVRFDLSFPAKGHEPHRDRERVMQTLSCETPIGPLSGKIVIFTGSKSRWSSKIEEMWGEFDIQSLKSEASLIASFVDIEDALVGKYLVENVPSKWSETGSAWILAEEHGGYHGGDPVVIDYVNLELRKESDNLYQMGITHKVLEELCRLPLEALKQGWSFKVEVSFPVKNWPTSKMPIDIVSETKDHDRRSVDRPLLVDPIGKPGYKKAYEAVLNSMSASEAIDCELGPCRQKDPAERQKLAHYAWCYMDRGDDPHGKSLRLPQFNSEYVARKACTIFEFIHKRFLRKQEERYRRIREARERALEEKRVFDIEDVRSNWRDMLSRHCIWTMRDSLHPDAFHLLHKIYTAQRRAEEIAGSRQEEEEGRIAEEEAKEDYANFMTGGAWDKLNGLKL